MHPQAQKKVARAYRIEGSIVLYRPAARNLFKAARPRSSTEPFWNMVFGVPLFLRTLLCLVFVCLHRHKGPPIALREPIPFNLPGWRSVHIGESYVTCLDCGQKFAYNRKTGQLVDFWGVHDAEALAGVRWKVVGFFSPLRNLVAWVGRLPSALLPSALIRAGRTRRTSSIVPQH